MRIKVVTVFLVLLGLLIAATVFRVDQMFFADKLGGSEAQARIQVGAVTGSLQAELRLATDTLTQAWPQVSSEQKDFAKGLPYSRFHMMASMQRAPSGEWTLEPARFLEETPVRAWAANYSMLALRQLDEAEISVGSSRVLSLLDPTRRVFFLIIHRAPSGWLAALSGPDLFQSAIDRQKGTLSSVYVVNTLGQALAHTTPEYVGSLLTEDPIVSDLMTSDSGAGSGLFKSAHGTIQGLYERVPNTNVFVAAATPMSQILGGRREMMMQLVLLGVGFALVGLAVILALGKSGEASKKTAAAPLTTPAQVPVAPTPAMKAYTKAAAGLAHELRGPLLSLLGQARLLRESVSDDQLAEELRKLEEGAREAHGTLHKMLTFAGEKTEPVVETSVGEVIRRTMRLLDGQFRAKNIEIVTEIPGDLPLIQGQPLMLGRAFEQIFLNAIEAMDRSSQKKLTVQLSRQDSTVAVKIQDTGSGIAPENLSAVFDPFFTTKSKSDHSGLGLSLAFGVIKGLGGELQIQSNPTGGTTVDVTFKIEATSPVVADLSRDVLAAPAATVTPEAEDRTVVLDAPVAPLEPSELPEVLNEKLMQRTLDMIDRLEDVNEPFAEEPSSASPSRQASEEITATGEMVTMGSSPSHDDFMKFTAKLDKPKSRKPSQARTERLLEVPTDVRRPGDRL